MYDILVYLFENCQQAELTYDRERVAKKLSAAGFDDSDISEALHWLAGVLLAPHGVPQKLPDSRASACALARVRVPYWRRTVEPLAGLHLSSPAFRAPWEKNSSSQRSRRSPPTSRARSVVSRARAITSRVTNICCRPRSAICSSSRFRTSTR